MYGPKGIGALVTKTTSPCSLCNGVAARSGTQSRHLATLIVGFAAAVRLAMAERESRQQRLAARDQLWTDLQHQILVCN